MRSEYQPDAPARKDIPRWRVGLVWAKHMTHDAILNQLRQRFGDAVVPSTFRDNQRVTVPAEKVLAVLESLKRDGGFDLLSELSAADYLHYPGARDRYGVWYILVNTATGARLIVK